MQRPTGITVLAVLAAIAGILGLLASLALLGIGTGAGAAASGFLMIAAMIALAYSVLSLALAYGFWTLKPWAWPLGVGVQVLGILQAVVQYVNNPNQLVSAIISVAIAAFILWYLFQPHVKAAFGRA
ncbi:MAG TPA: DUF2127 domain-containing protein [Candidatus Limnocylindria bacterium]|nr:DUF2127 domain-containing protein [Candidatus Limnocylindria bacterium]